MKLLILILLIGCSGDKKSARKLISCEKRLSTCEAADGHVMKTLTRCENVLKKNKTYRDDFIKTLTKCKKQLSKGGHADTFLKTCMKSARKSVERQDKCYANYMKLMGK